LSKISTPQAQLSCAVSAETNTWGRRDKTHAGAIKCTPV
jgi:hypothetical protein